MADENVNKKPHAIFIPYPLQGHVIPSVHLAVKLASRGLTVTFINTHAVHRQISRAHHGCDDIFADVRKSDPTLDIRYATLSDGLPECFDRSLHHDQFMASLLHVFSAHVEEAVERIVRTSSGGGDEEEVRFLIADTFFVWPSEVARKFGLIYVSFWTEPAMVFSLYYHIHLLRNNAHFGCQDRREDIIDYIPGIKSIQRKDMTSYLQEADTSTVCHQIIFKCFQDVRSADFIICNTVQELEPDTVSALQAKQPFYSIGPIIPKDLNNGTITTSLWTESDCSHWLKTKHPGSVVYVSFGSYAHVSRNDLHEIAHGISLSKVPFVWVLRPDIVSSKDTDPLPDGYKEEIKDQGIIVPWCSQLKVLSDPAIGGFLTHCGWNSIIESIWNEVPLLCFPLLTDQFTNRKLAVDDWKIGINLTDKEKITKEEVAEKINRLRSTAELKNNIQEVKKKLQGALLEGGSSDRNMDQLIKDLTDKIKHTKAK